jgi:cytochrome c553
MLLLSVGATFADESVIDPAAVPVEQMEFFEKEVRPLLVEHCYRCHSDRAQKGNLRLDSRRAVVAGGDTGPAIVPGKPAESLLIDAVSYGELYQMPPSGKLADQQIEVLRRWVEQGAPWPNDRPTSVAEGNAPASKAAFDLAERAKQWAFQPLDTQPQPTVNNAASAKAATDIYILSKLEAANLPPAEAADKRTLLRRTTFDLIGLPPTPEEMADFLSDDRPDAFQRVVDRLLASPHYGERWARHWLDLVRYAESKGHEFDYTIPNAWQYRDYVIRAFNADVPYDQFAIEHVAGDLLEEPRRNPDRGFNESILGTGFWFLGEEVHSPVELKADELDRNDNKIDVFSKTFLALTVACARCHDHKFDAITTKDYYALSGYLLSASYRQAAFDGYDAQRKLAQQLADLRTAQRPKLMHATHAAMRPVLDRLSELLLATRQVLQATGSGDDAAAARAQAIEAVAARNSSPSWQLTSWVDAVRQAATDTTSPLYPWAIAATAQGEARASPGLRISPLIESAKRPLPAAASSDASVVVDYGKLLSSDWRQDGLAFGLRPAKVGEVSFGPVERPISRVWDRGAAIADPIWNAAVLAPGVEREAGRLAWLQSGRMLRTPTFTLDGRKLYYQVSGSGYAYAVVHSHRMNNGPLHGALIREWQAGERFQWIEHNLSAYRGQRVHIEFSPRQAGEIKPDASPVLAVAQVVQADQPPTNDVAAMLALDLSAADLASPEALALAYQRRFTQVAEQLASDALREQNHAALADWLLRNLRLFAPPESESCRSLAAAAQPFIEMQAALVKEALRPVHTAPAMFDGNGVDECVMLRGNPKTPGQVVPRRYLEALGGVEGSLPASGSGRLELARRMTDPSRPLVARVIVNRVLQHLFGRGIVASADNFGVMGEPPTHRELLDRLTRDFMSDGWSMKRLIHRLVLTSSYQRSSRPSEAARQRDPNNLLLSHGSIKRLEAEAIRDSILAVSGRLDRRMFGPSTPTYLSEFMEGRGRPASGPVDGDGRRSIYLSVRRNFLSSFFLAFDYPVPFSAVGRRSVSNVPAQALTLLNSPLVAGEARRWAATVEREPSEQALKIGKLYLTAFGRPPTEDEIRQSSEFVAAQSRRYASGPADIRLWADLCHVLLNAKEFVFVQ